CFCWVTLVRPWLSSVTRVSAVEFELLKVSVLSMAQAEAALAYEIDVTAFVGSVVEVGRQKFVSVYPVDQTWVFSSVIEVWT
ncbi:hypothetical protein ACJEM9_24960, partial [Escherichia coli]